MVIFNGWFWAFSNLLRVTSSDFQSLLRSMVMPSIEINLSLYYVTSYDLANYFLIVSTGISLISIPLISAIPLSLVHNLCATNFFYFIEHFFVVLGL